MGLFSRIFGGGTIKSVATNTSFLGAYRESSGKGYGGGGWGLERFNSVIDAHSSVEDIIDEWGLDAENCKYPSIDGYENCYAQAWAEEYQKACMEAEILAALGENVDPEDLMDFDVVEENTYEYATYLVEAWLDGTEWIPEEIMDWAWYVLSDHNM